MLSPELSTSQAFKTCGLKMMKSGDGPENMGQLPKEKPNLVGQGSMAHPHLRTMKGCWSPVSFTGEETMRQPLLGCI